MDSDITRRVLGEFARFAWSLPSFPRISRPPEQPGLDSPILEFKDASLCLGDWAMFGPSNGGIMCKNTTLADQIRVAVYMKLATRVLTPDTTSGQLEVIESMP